MFQAKEVEPPYRIIIYNRTGNLAKETRLDQAKADQFMRVADMRRTIEIVDSDALPQRSAVAVGSDVLAFRSIEPINRLTAQIFKAQRYHTLVRDDNTWTIQIHERQIDADVRNGHFIDRADYNRQFLGFVNRAVRGGLQESLWREKLGYDQAPGYFIYSLLLTSPSCQQNIEALVAHTVNVDSLFNSLIAFFGVNLLAQAYSYLDIIRTKSMYGDIFIDRKRSPRLRDWKEALLPNVPIDRWLRGTFYLATQGEELILPH